MTDMLISPTDIALTNRTTLDFGPGALACSTSGGAGEVAGPLHTTGIRSGEAARNRSRPTDCEDLPFEAFTVNRRLGIDQVSTDMSRI